MSFRWIISQFRLCWMSLIKLRRIREREEDVKGGGGGEGDGRGEE